MNKDDFPIFVNLNQSSAFRSNLPRPRTLREEKQLPNEGKFTWLLELHFGIFMVVFDDHFPIFVFSCLIVGTRK